MRLDKQIRALIGRSATAGVLALLFAFGIPMSVFGQTAPGTAAPAASPTQTAGKPQLPPEIANGTPLTIEDAVKMALENNLGVQAARLNTEVQTLSLIHI